MKKKIWLSSLAALVLALLVIGIAAAQDQSPTPPGITDDQVNAIARQMYCPVCENTPLDVCPTQACAEWRELIRDELAQGWSETADKGLFRPAFRRSGFGDATSHRPELAGLCSSPNHFPGRCVLTLSGVPELPQTCNADRYGG